MKKSVTNSEINPLTGKPFGTYTMEEMFVKGWRNAPIDRQVKHLFSPGFTLEERNSILNACPEERRNLILQEFKNNPPVYEKCEHPNCPICNHN